MALITLKPTSPGRRAMVRVSTPGLHKGDPYGPLTESQSNTGGRNHYGRITTRHKGGGSKQNYRIIDFKRDKEGIACRIERIEYDPNRTAHIALLCFADGERRYIIAPKGVNVGDQLMAGRDAPIKAGNSLPLRNIPIGSTVHWEFDVDGFRTVMLDRVRRVAWTDVKRVRTLPNFWLFRVKREELLLPTFALNEAVRDLIRRQAGDAGAKFVER